MNVLVVEDSALEREYIANILQTVNFTWVLAGTGEEGLNLVKEKSIDVILLDIIMPGIDGYEVCKRLKKDEATKDIPVIFITGSDDIENLKKAFEVGGVDFISKPVNKYNVLARVKVHFENKQLIENLKSEIDKRKKAEDNLKEANDQYLSQNEELMQIIEQLDVAKSELEQKEKRIRELILNEGDIRVK